MASGPASVKTQINFAIKLGVAALVALTLLWMCVREPLRRMMLDHPHFDAVFTVSLPQPTSCLTAGDFNGDGLDDLLMNINVRQAPRLEIWLSQGGDFSTERVWTLPDALVLLSAAAADLDGDGLDDLVATSPGENARQIMIWRNRGNGQLEISRFEASLQLIDLVDDDGDGDPDLIGLTRNFGEIAIRRNSGGEFESNPSISDAINDTSLRGLSAGHLGDGGADVALQAINREGGRIRIFRSGGFVPDPTAHFNLPPTWVNGQSLSNDLPSFDLADVNGDDRTDLVLVDSNEVVVMLSLGGAEFVPSKRHVPSPPASRLVTGDFNGDGRTDLLAVDPGGNTLTVLLARP